MALFGNVGRRNEPGEGKKFKFHGSFDSKKSARTREQEVKGFIIERTVKGKRRYFVLTEK